MKWSRDMRCMRYLATSAPEQLHPRNPRCKCHKEGLIIGLVSRWISSSTPCHLEWVLWRNEFNLHQNKVSRDSLLNLNPWLSRISSMFYLSLRAFLLSPSRLWMSAFTLTRDWNPPSRGDETISRQNNAAVNAVSSRWSTIEAQLFVNDV